MFAAPNEISLMSFRGQYFINIGTKSSQVPSCVMIRGVYIDNTLVSGPGRVSKALNGQFIEGKIIGLMCK